MVARPVEYLEILDRSWEEMDCRAVVLWVYRMAGVDLPAEAVERAGAGTWDLVGRQQTAATQVLDVIASDPHGRGCESHLSVVVRASSPRTVLTSARMGGVVAMRPWALQRVLGVYRLRGATA
jgi:hypothetical protein